MSSEEIFKIVLLLVVFFLAAPLIGMGFKEAFHGWKELFKGPE